MPEKLPHYRGLAPAKSDGEPPEENPIPLQSLTDAGLHDSSRSSSSPVNVFPPTTSFHFCLRSNKSEELDSISANSECKDPDSALAYIDDILKGELAAYDMFDTKDTFAVFSCSPDFSLLPNTPLSSCSFDELNASIVERLPCGSLTKMEQQKPLPNIDANYFSSEQSFLLNRVDTSVSIAESGIVVACPEDHLEWQIQELQNSWPVLSQPRAHQCNRCQVLRQIVHTNGPQGTKLEIHGCESQNYHAVLQTRFWLNNGCPPRMEQQIVEFPVGNLEYIKQFLLQYSLLRKKEGFMLQHDDVLSGANVGLRLSSVVDGCTTMVGSCGLIQSERKDREAEDV